MDDLEIINKGMVELWRGDGWFTFTQFLKPKRIKFFLVNANGEFRVRLKDKILYEGKDLNKALEIYNSI